MQIVLPVNHKNVAYKFHNCSSGGYLGVAKTAAKVCNKFNILLAGLAG
jgi:hypothetical protein